MTQVDFYVLSTTDPTARRAFSCRLAEKAWKAGHRVYIRVSDATEAGILDDLLWTFRQGSFVPHSLRGSDTDSPPVAVLIGTGHAPETYQGLLINLTPSPPEDWQGFHRIAEIVTADETIRKEGRDKFRFYQTQNLKPVTHKLD